MNEDNTLSLFIGVCLILSCVGCVGGAWYQVYHRRDDSYQGLNTV
jgi:hypothetical protein